MSIVTLIADLVRAGTDPELVGRVADAFASRKSVDEQAERRRAADRERKRSSSIPQNSAESAEMKTAKEIPPTPPKENNTLTNVRVNIIARETDFEALRKAYPKRDGHDPRQPAWKAFQNAVKRGADPAAMIDGARRYAAFMATSDPKFIKHLASWINQQCWLDDYSGPRPRAGPNTRPKADGYTTAIAELFGGKNEPVNNADDEWSGSSFDLAADDFRQIG